MWVWMQRVGCYPEVGATVAGTARDASDVLMDDRSNLVTEQSKNSPRLGNGAREWYRSTNMPIRLSYIAVLGCVFMNVSRAIYAYARICTFSRVSVRSCSTLYVIKFDRRLNGILPSARFLWVDHLIELIDRLLSSGHFDHTNGIVRQHLLHHY